MRRVPARVGRGALATTSCISISVRSPSSAHDAVFDAIAQEWRRRFDRDMTLVGVWSVVMLLLTWG